MARNKLTDYLGDLYMRGLARNVNALANVAGPGVPDPRVYAPGAEWVPGIGDAVGLGKDIRGYIDNPNSLTPLSGMLSLAAMAPAVPSRSAMRSAEEIADNREVLRGVIRDYMDGGGDPPTYGRVKAFLQNEIKTGRFSNFFEGGKRWNPSVLMDDLKALKDEGVLAQWFKEL